ncbi:MAG TPA: hypothetical protein VF717_01125 [Pyrinomonadaceae bacterium]|jgi:hypothetical protein
MGDWLMQFVPEMTWQNAVIGAVLFIVTFGVSSALVSFVLVRLPATFFHPSHDRDILVDRHHVIRWSGIVIKNLIGFALVIVGIIMSIPGVPGPGFLTILFGIALLDFPGKRTLEYKIVSRPKVFQAINALRRKFNKPPLVL